jgi:dsDNA-binding SOS-regulon protein
MAAHSCVLLPINDTLTEYSGFVSAVNRQFRIRLALKSPAGQVDAASFSCDEQLAALLNDAGVLPSLQARLAQAADISAFLAELRDVLQRVLRTTTVTRSAPAEYYTRFVGEIDKIGWSSLASMDLELGKLQLVATDDTGREHLFTVALPTDYPR